MASPRYRKNTQRLLCASSIMFVVFIIGMNFGGTVKNVGAERAYWSVEVSGGNKGLAGQAIYVEVATEYGFYQKKKATPNLIANGNDAGGYSCRFSIPEEQMSRSIEALATAKDGSQASAKSVTFGGGKCYIYMNDVGLCPAYLKVYATNRIAQPITFTVYESTIAMGTFTVEGNAKDKYIGTVSKEFFYGNTQSDTWFTAKWGDSVWEKSEYPSGSGYGIKWGAGVGGPADSVPSSAYFQVGTVQPTLTGSVSPSSGDTNTKFTFTVTYKHPNGDTIYGMDLYIDDNKYTMTKVGGTEKSGVTYIYNTTLPVGTHQYYFSAHWKVGTVNSEVGLVTVTNPPSSSEPQNPSTPSSPSEPVPKIILAPQHQYSECYAGRTTSCIITAENEGDKEGIVLLSSTPPYGDWTIKISNETGTIYQTTPILLGVGQSKPFTVNITVPSNIANGIIGDTIITAKVNGTIHSNATIITTIREFPGAGVSLTAIDTEKIFDNGGEEKYLISIRNEYDQLNSITISASSQWQTTIYDTNDTPLSTFELLVNGSKQFYVKVVAPELAADDAGTYGGTSITIDVTATSSTLTKSATVNVTGRIKITSNITLIPTLPASGEQKGTVGNEIWYTIEARNGGNTPNILDGISCYGTWSNWRGKVSIYKDRSESLFSDTNKINGIDTGTIPVNGSVNMFVKVKIAEDAADGAAETITVKGKPATSLNKETNTTLKAIAETPGIMVYPKSLNKYGRPGQTISCLFNVSNKQNFMDWIEIACNSSQNATAGLFDYETRMELERKDDFVSVVPINSKTEKGLTVNVAIPQTSPAGSNIITTITVTSPRSGKFDTAAINTTILPSVGIDISVKNKTSDGANTICLLNITNTGNIPDIINVRYASTLNWKTELLWEDGTMLSDTNNDSIVDIGELITQGTKTITLIVTAPPNIDAGLINRITLNASSSREPEYYKQETFNEVSSTEVGIDEKEVYVLSESGRISTVLTNGTNITITAIVRNLGTANLESESGFEVRFYIVTNESGKLNYTLAGNAMTICNLSANSSVKVSTTHFLDFSSVNKAKIVVEVEPIYDKDARNNVVEKNVTIKYSSAMPIDVSETTADYTMIGVASGLVAIGAVGATSAFLFRRRELL